MGLRSSIRSAGTATLGSVESLANAVTRGTTSLDRIAEVGELHATEYRDRTKFELESNREVRNQLAEQTSRIRIAQRLHEIRAELNNNPELMEIYKELGNETPKLSAVS